MSAHTLENGAHSPERRRVLVGAIAGAFVPCVFSAKTDANTEQASFLGVSAFLTGSDTLDPQQARRLYAALDADDAGFPARMRELLALLDSRKPDPLRLQQMLDDEKSPLAGLPRMIASAWWLGIVGDNDKARCVEFEKALNAQLVADVLKPPTYAYGAYGSWARKPG
jgi:hypothetical protein